MNYKIYNDFEIIYLIKEGNELAYNIMFLKYENYIWKIVSSFYPYGSKMEDLVQEGRMILHNCILSYDSYMGISFFSYFTICLKRKIHRELAKTYYDEYITLRDNYCICEYNNKLANLTIMLTKEEEEIYDWCFKMGKSLKQYTDKKGISYYDGVKKYRCLLSKIKENYGL